ncbi:hypothetical protein A3C20_00545 [Candidatus Kaiserbacteria bacterium RIFCSPHIGHO2_02_FULL_55_25]|uniref:Uncharacterized protein n=1 Tax=Candidatus Kaiserbacteria bacterium RIFCSPHIGHO2_02_FULL_55_25 TaxID=1798498 RepID=A0A1F6E642_9BACT|nr:MAG: hypothetical protein A2764_03475 [Candidatus Kaiserbacteria bacterium RIFCSPHIGHO2_01_FULL_55_79]OGG68662.1 MAG: hypothetical protein A3C20_00545 [Candidatus Kaiserbacteria bacterium RIFCSPHIGHO2_02_FULL_55_25]OGG78686.1 MAG: hypothetical protein A3F56_01400 [Candidatus Kaiserbacteria bacterium RIFCSPHIGHO2_12_FULL_55_13]OGG83033.1 MAG: hypothetical protein A3A42_01505 [Candidatus Kaiserbacteria bacterium RIFCSPLOWO2_01_FULL_55_25]
MTLDALIMLSGGFVAVLPFLGFPNSWDSVLFFLAGVFIIGLGIVVRRRGLGLDEDKRGGARDTHQASRTPLPPDTTQGEL